MSIPAIVRVILRSQVLSLQQRQRLNALLSEQGTALDRRAMACLDAAILRGEIELVPQLVGALGEVS